MGNPILRKVAAPVPLNQIKSQRFQQLLADMAETMVEYDGRGLAAPQVHESIQVVVVLWDFDPKEKPAIKYLINPVIKAVTTETSSFWEGCLSVPGLRGLVARPNKISVEGYDEKGDPFTWQLEGFAATVVQHEVDHLLGKLYVDRISDMSYLAFQKEYLRFWHKEGDDLSD